MLQRALREGLRREAMPDRLLWWMAVDGMNAWSLMLSRGLAPHLGGEDRAREVIARVSAPMFRRRYGLLSAAHHHLPDPAHDPSVVGRLLGALYRFAPNARPSWVLAHVGGEARTPRDRLDAARLLAPLTPRQRWDEVAAHLGDQLIALTQSLPGEGLPQANAVLGKICFEGGVRYAETAQRAMRLPASPDSAIEVLRMSEYIFQVNPDHWQHTDETTGYLEGTSCPWWHAPGWSMMHCGIFGQFQAGITSVYGLRYQLTRTIPKHGGLTCRIDLKPIKLRVPASKAVT